MNIVLRYFPKKYILFFYVSCIFLFPAVSFSQVQINSITTTPSTCPNNGSITVTAQSSNTPLLYSITAGPVIEPAQTNNVFNSLPAGNYTITVIDIAADSATKNATITGNYLNPDFNPITSPPYCAGGSDGQIIGNRITGTGNGPFTWQLIAPSPVTTVPQTSDTFNNLSAGNYTVRLTDACGSFRTIVATVSTPVFSFSFSGPLSVQITGCDSAVVTIPMYASLFRFPLTYQIETTNNSFTTTTQTVLDTVSGSDGYFTALQLLPNFTYGNFVKITVTDACGNSISSPVDYAKPFNFCATPDPYFSSCSYYSPIVYDLNNAGCNTSNSIITYAKPPLVYQFTDAVTNAILDSGTLAGYSNNYGLNLISGVTVKSPPTNKTYNITIKDGCGKVFTQSYFVPAPVIKPPVITETDIYQSGCLDSTAFAFVFTDNFKTQPRLILLSGPSTMGSTKSNYVYHDPYSYPDTIVTSGIGGTTYRFDISNLSVGKFQFEVIDSCGSQAFDSLVITPADVTNLGDSIWYKKGCLGQNELHYSFNSANGVISIQNISTGTTWFKQYQSQNLNALINDSVLNVPAGTYTLNFSYLAYYASGTPANDSILSCQIRRDSITIASYQTPQISTANSLVCHNAIDVEVVPDSSKGVPPYQYEIISGPQTFPVQTSNLFSVAQAGTYTVRIFDVCGNASTAQITVAAIVFPPINKIAASCNSAKLFYGSSIYYTYKWTRPNGTIYTGDTLTVDPITATDTGTYSIGKIVNINGCTDTFYTAYHLSLTASFTQTIPFCNGTTVNVGPHIYNAPGTYIDTLAKVNALGCDSIVTTILIVLLQKKDTNNVTICKGDSITVGSNAYKISGLYKDSVQNTGGCYDLVFTNLTVKQLSDTMNIAICANDSVIMGADVYKVTGIYNIDTLASSMGCDSLIVLNLIVNPPLQTLIPITVQEVICEGDSLPFGTTMYYQSGFYQDTVVISNCQEIVIPVNLIVNPYKKDSIVQSICAGQSFIFGVNAYTQTGIYRDTLSTTTCDSIVILNLTVNNYKKDSINEVICAGQGYPFNGNVYTQDGIYRDTLSTTTCDSIAILNLTVSNYKKDSINEVICAGQSYPFNGNEYTQVGIYRDTLSTTTCDSIAILNLTVNNYKKDSINEAICVGQSYRFNGNGYTQAGIYRDTLSTTTCDSIVTLNLTVYLAPSIKIITSSAEVSRGETIQLNTTETAHSYLWTSMEMIDNNTVQDPKAIINNSVWIFLQATDDVTDCPASDSVYIFVRPGSPDSTISPCSGSYIYVPNAFTPNNDNLNDIFKPVANNITLQDFQIYNRWGQMVFETTDIHKGWNGTFQGQLADVGNYVYWLSYFDCTNTSKPKTIKGNIILIR